MKKKLIGLFLGLMMVLGLGLVINKQAVQAAPYGAKLYTTPKSLRGTWHYKSGKAMPDTGVQGRYMNPYSKIRITRHTITFTCLRGKNGLKGKYTLYKSTRKHWSTKKMAAAEKYATKHKWLAPYGATSKRFGISNYWLHVFESTACGEFASKGNRTMTFSNAYYKDTFRK